MGLRALRVSFPLKWAMGATVLFPFFWVIQLQWSPIAFERDGLTGLLIAWTIGCAGLIIGSYATRFAQKVEVTAIIGSLALIAIVLLLLPSAGLWLTPFLLFGWRFSRGVFDPAMTAFTQTRIESSYRATYGSLQSFLGRLSATAIFVFMGFRTFGKDFGIAVNDVYLTSGFVLLAGVVVLFLFAAWIDAPKKISS